MDIMVSPGHHLPLSKHRPSWEHPSPNRLQSKPCFAPLSVDQPVSSKTPPELPSNPALNVATPPPATANTPNPPTSLGQSPPSSSLFLSYIPLLIRYLT